MKTKSLIYTVFFIGLLSSLYQCKKDVIKTAPIVTITSIANITANAATSGGNITNDGGDAVTARGVCWSTSQNPTTSDHKTSNGSGKGSFTSSITELTTGTTYYLMAYAINSEGTAYSNQSIFTTLALAPVLTTTEISAITSTSANSGGKITDDGGSRITARGVCWSTSPNLTTTSSKTSDGIGIGIFASSITGLNPGVAYYVRAYATNSIGTAYGNQITLATTALLPAITTTAASAIASTTATSGGNITSDGGSAVTTRGVCWGTSQNPTTASSKTSDGTGTGSFASSITGLTPGLTYYIRAYATNGIGTAYGNQITASTTAALPTVSTITVTDITATTATSGGNITNDGGSMVSARGVCWSTSQNPTIDNSKSTDGTGTGNFTSSITGLTAATTYYIRAYATNGAGTAYGSQINFTSASGGTGNTVTDIDGNIYHTVVIGTQTWMVENLKTTKYRDGEPITNVTNNAIWAALPTGAFCWYNNDELTNKDTYGALYNGYSVSDIRNIAPVGWHVPSDAEWTTLTSFLGGESVAGGKLKEFGTAHWQSPNTGASNCSGFTAFPGGIRNNAGDGTFSAITGMGVWWSSSMVLNGTFSWIRWLYSYKSESWRVWVDNNSGVSVRCVKD